METTLTEAEKTNRIIAAYMGYERRRFPGRDALVWVKVVDGKDVVQEPPDYWNSADAVLPVVERICRERELQVSFEWEPADRWFVVFFNSSLPEMFWVDAIEITLPSAACLAIVAVIGDLNNERTA